MHRSHVDHTTWSHQWRTVFAVPKENDGAVGATSPCSRGRELKALWTTLRTLSPPLSCEPNDDCRWAQVTRSEGNVSVR